MSIGATLAAMMLSGLLNGSPTPTALGREAQVELKSLLVDAGLSPQLKWDSAISLKLAQVEFLSVTGQPATIAGLRDYNSRRTPSAPFRRMADGWLQTWYPHDSAAKALDAVERRLGVAKGPLSGRLAVTLIHLWGIRQAYLHHWRYRAEPNDTLTDLSVASGLSLAEVAKDNPLHFPYLWIGQVIAWRPPPTPAQPARPEVASVPPNSGNSAPTTPLATTGVLAGLRPVAGLAIIHPTAQALAALLTVQPLGQSVTIVVEAEWALLHPKLIDQAMRQGDTITFDGYSTERLDVLPQDGVRQELRWCRSVAHTIFKQSLVYWVDMPTKSNAMVVHTAQSLNFRIISAVFWPLPAGGWATTASRLLVQHPNQLAVIAPPASERVWKNFFAQVAREHTTLETLTQLWSSS